MDTKSILKESFKVYIKSGSFFEKWFKENSTPYYFTFKLNLSRTNIQYGEFKALIKSNITDISGDNSVGKRIQIHTVKMLNDSIAKIISAINFPIEEYRHYLKINKSGTKYDHDLENTLESLVNNYWELLSCTIVIDTLYGSCCLFVPPNLQIDIVSIMAFGGYLNTCGELVYIRNFNKANKTVFFDLLEKSINKSTTVKSIFNVFSHEDFTHTMYENHNIEHLKIHLDKFYFDSKPLSAILVELKEVFKDKLEVMLSYDNSIRDNSLDSFWMVKDCSTSSIDIKVAGIENYFICYKQILKNDSQLHVFNENKPAWKSNTSIPQTLIGAMINLAFGDLYFNKENIVIIDPFAGTGTTILELIKLVDRYNLEIYGSDLDVSFPILLDDNMKILAMNAKEIIILIENLEKENWINDYHKLLENIEELNLSRENEEFEIPKIKINKFKELPFIERIYIYIYFLVRINYTKSIERKNSEFRNTFFNEKSKLVRRLNELKEIMEHEEITAHKFNSLSNSFKIVKGRFSSKIVLKSEIFLNFKLENNIFGGYDFRQLKADSYDLIIGDPPYGFNMTHEIENLLKLYSDMAEVFVRSIKRGGQIILALPDRSYSGKHSPWFTHKEMVLTRFNFEAFKQNKSMISYTEINPSKEIFNPPFYWEAQKALRRSIIQMKFL